MIVRFLKLFSVLMFLGIPVWALSDATQYGSFSLGRFMFSTLIPWMLIPLMWGLFYSLRWAVTGKWKETEKE